MAISREMLLVDVVTSHYFLAPINNRDLVGLNPATGAPLWHLCNAPLPFENGCASLYDRFTAENIQPYNKTSNYALRATT